MFCTNCGKEIEDDSKFCTQCGATIIDGHAIPKSSQTMYSNYEETQPTSQGNFSQENQYNQMNNYNYQQNNYNQPLKDDKATIGFIILSILFPIVGIILYFVWKNQYPNSAKTYLYCGLIAWAVSFLIVMV